MGTVDISPDGRYVLSGGVDAFILWDILQGKKIQTFTHESFQDIAISVAFSPDGKYFASGGKGAKLWDLATRQVNADKGHERGHGHEDSEPGSGFDHSFCIYFYAGSAGGL